MAVIFLKSQIISHLRHHQGISSSSLAKANVRKNQIIQIHKLRSHSISRRVSNKGEKWSDSKFRTIWKICLEMGLTKQPI